jgi:CRP/FNR family transcriptional regulator, cyclic AMP receptor protein
MTDAVELEDSQLFSGLPREVLAEIRAISKSAKYPRGKVIFREDEPATQVWLLRSGAVRLAFTDPAGWEHNDFEIAVLRPGQAFGWTTLLGHDKLTSQAKAVEDAEVILIPGAELNAILNRDVRVGFIVMQRLLAAVSNRFRETRAQLRWLLFDGLKTDSPSRRAGVAATAQSQPPAR